MGKQEQGTVTGLENFERTDGLFSLCGLNCGLCGYRLQGNCDGCFKESFCAETCPRVPCSIRHGNLQYCFECPEYPCKHYDGFDSYDTLVLHRNQRKDMQKAKDIGIGAYLAEQRQKVGLLDRLLKSYDDGHSLVFFCSAVNMLSVDDMRSMIDKADSETEGMAVPERAEHIENMLRAFADRNGIRLRSNRPADTALRSILETGPASGRSLAGRLVLIAYARDAGRSADYGSMLFSLRAAPLHSDVERAIMPLPCLSAVSAR